MDAEMYKVHDIIVREQQHFPATGGVEQQKVVQFSVGMHGPFTLTFKAADYTPEKVRAAIMAEVEAVKQTLQIGG